MKIKKDWAHYKAADLRHQQEINEMFQQIRLEAAAQKLE